MTNPFSPNDELLAARLGRRVFFSFLAAVPVLIVFLAATYLLWKNEQQNAVERLQVVFGSNVDDIGIRIQQRMEIYGQVLQGAQGLFAASKSVEREEFHEYVSRLYSEEKFPGMKGVYFSVIVPASEKASHIAAVRKEGFPEYTIKPEEARQIYTSALYLEPFSGRNLRAFGFDNFTDQTRRAAMEQARVSGKIAISRKVMLLHEDNVGQRTGFRMYAPIYRNGSPVETPAERRANITGWVYLPFDMAEFMTHVIEDYAKEFGIEIFDGAEISSQMLMYDSKAFLRTVHKAGPRFQTIRHVKVADHVWTMAIGSLPAFEEQSDSEKSRLIALAGITASVLAAFIAWLLVYGRLRAQEAEARLAVSNLGLEERVKARTADLEESKEMLEAGFREMQQLNMQLKEAQDHLLQSEKMASIGQLAAGVAHEINNPIGYVHSNLGTLEKYLQDMTSMLDSYEQAEGAISDEPARARVQAERKKLDIAFLKEDLCALMSESKDGITRVKQIVQNLKDFSHVDASDTWHFADLHKGIDSTLNIVHNEIKYKASVIKEYGELPEVECLSSQLNQVFMNLLVNAAHAIEERGTITVRTGRQGDEVWVEIQDTGKGIAPEHLQKIFDPFFTTKPIGKGTGLGLSLSYGIVQKHHGRIEVQSEVGKGTTFRVWLPVARGTEDIDSKDGSI